MLTLCQISKILLPRLGNEEVLVTISYHHGTALAVEVEGDLVCG
jgi:hypothetical protein